MVRKLDNIALKTTFEQVRKKLCIEEPEDIEFVFRLLEKAKEIAKPKVLYREAFIEEISGDKVRINGYDFKSDVLAMSLKDIHRVFAYVCTCGTEVDDWSHSKKDSVVSIWLDIIKGMFLGEATAFLHNHIKDVYQFEKLSSVNPGSGNVENWPISQQAQLFAMIGDVKKEIGVTLTDSYLMVPTKSVSGLLFPSNKGFSNCILCTRENCPNRGAEFDKELYARTFNKYAHGNEI